MRAPPNRIVSSKIRNLQPNVNWEMQLFSVTKVIDNEAIGVLAVRAVKRSCATWSGLYCQSSSPGAFLLAAPHHSFLRHSRCWMLHPGKYCQAHAPPGIHGRAHHQSRRRHPLRRPPVHLSVRPWRRRGGDRRPRDGDVCEPFLRSQLRDRRRRGTGLHRRHSRHCRWRRTYLRLLPLRWRRRGALFLRQQKLPGEHVLSRRIEENGACRSPQEETGRTGGEGERRRAKSENEKQVK